MNFYEYLNKTNFNKKLGSGVRVAIIDSGCNSDFPNIVGRFNGFTNKSDVSDDTGHGTAIGNIIYEIVPNCDLYICKALNSKNIATMESVYNCLAYVYSKDIDVVCMSFAGIHELSITTMRVLRDVQRNGTMLFASVGNDNQPTLVFPASVEGVYSVSGLSKDNLDTKLHSANYPKDSIDFTALGEDIQTQYDVIKRSGTSFSNAIVVGQVAYILSYNKKRAKEIDYNFLKKYMVGKTKKTDIGFGHMVFKEDFNEC